MQWVVDDILLVITNSISLFIMINQYHYSISEIIINITVMIMDKLDE